MKHCNFNGLTWIGLAALALLGPGTARAQMDTYLTASYGFDRCSPGAAYNVRSETLSYVHVDNANTAILVELFKAAYNAYGMVSPFLGPAGWVKNLLSPEALALLQASGYAGIPDKGLGLYENIKNLSSSTHFDRTGEGHFNVVIDKKDFNYMFLRFSASAGDRINLDFVRNHTATPVQNSPPGGVRVRGTSWDGHPEDIELVAKDGLDAMRTYGPIATPGDTKDFYYNVYLHPRSLPTGTYPFTFATKEPGSGEWCGSCLSTLISGTVTIVNSCTRQGLIPVAGCYAGCMPCPNSLDRVNPSTGLCEACAPGSVPEGTTCRTCGANEFVDLIPTSSGNKAVCKACPAGYFPDENHRRCVSGMCRLGDLGQQPANQTYYPNGNTTITFIPGGNTGWTNAQPRESCRCLAQGGGTAGWSCNSICDDPKMVAGAMNPDTRRMTKCFYDMRGTWNWTQSAGAYKGQLNITSFSSALDGSFSGTFTPAGGGPNPIQGKVLGTDVTFTRTWAGGGWQSFRLKMTYGGSQMSGTFDGIKYPPNAAPDFSATRAPVTDPRLFDAGGSILRR